MNSKAMNYPSFYFLLFLICLLFACLRTIDHTTGFENKHPTVVAAREYRIPSHKISPPVIVRAEKVTKRLAGKPEIVKLKSNIFPALVSSTVTARSPETIFPNGKQYERPRVVHAASKPYLAGAPEVT